MKKSKTPAKSDKTPGKRAYKKPKVVTESLLAFGALCNGRTGSGRKDSPSLPANCSASKLLS